MANRDMVVVGASAGGVEALQQICAALPADLNAAVLVVLHTSPHAGGLLANILDRAGPMKALTPRDGERIENGIVYVAPPNLHMLVEDGHLRLIGGPRENRHRPAIDPTFRSAALSYGQRVVGIVLTGGMNDGTSGLMVIRAHGGIPVVQDPNTALFSSMPKSALRMVTGARVASLEEIPGLIQQLVSEPIPESRPPKARDEIDRREVRMAEFDMSEIERDLHVGKPSVFGCPECGGVLWEIDQEGLLRYRCRVGHAYTADNLEAEQRFNIETALWAALRALEESAALYRKLANQGREKNMLTLVSFEENALTAEKNSHILRDFLVNLNRTDADEEKDSKDADAA
jgi:two-component system chemotaxis response regulator CheB